MNEMIRAEYKSASGISITLDEETVLNFCTRGNANITKQEVALFIRTCQAKRLDPLENGEVYLIKYDNAKPAQIVVGKHAYNRRADNNPEYMGKKSGIVVVRENLVVQKEGCCPYKELGEILIGGWCRVFRQRAGRPGTEETFREVSLEEYNKGQSNWKDKPATMIEKVAVGQCLREAFPNDYEGLYSEDEMVASGAIPADIIDTDGSSLPGIEDDGMSEPASQEQRRQLFCIAQGNLGKEEGNQLLRSIMEEMGMASTTGMTVRTCVEIADTLRERISEIDPTADDPDEDSEALDGEDFREE